MSVSIIFSLANGDTAIDSEVDHSTGSNGDTFPVSGDTPGYEEIFIRHDGLNAITNVRTYIRALSSDYDGDATALSDFAELIAWGNATAAADFGGFQINMDAIGSYAGWPTLGSKDTAQGRTCRTSVGDSSAAANTITISTTTGATSSGTIQAGSSPNVRFACRIVVPTSEDTVGVRLFEQCFLYDYTS